MPSLNSYRIRFSASGWGWYTGHYQYFDDISVNQGGIKLPRTGQSTCYDSAGAVILCAGTGQDGEIQAGVPWPDPRFTDNGDGTVTDNLNGLMWIKNANLMASRDPGFDLDSGPAGGIGDGKVTWQHALDYVKKLNAEAYLGYNDWRLPNVKELESLSNVGVLFMDMSTWLNWQGFSGVESTSYWSSTAYATSTSNTWVINMWDGDMYAVPHILYGYDVFLPVWPVRSGQSGNVNLPQTGQNSCYDSAGTVIYCTGTGEDGEIQAGVSWPSPRFIDNGDGTVTDNLNSLMWTKNANLPITPKTWQQGLDYVAGMNAGIYPNFGYTDWCLPNRKELHSLIDFSQYSPSLQSGHPFLNVQSSSYWSSTTHIRQWWDSAWCISMGDGSMLENTKSNNYYIWPVRGGQTLDSDDDGFSDYLDNCPYDPNPDQTNTDGDDLGNVCDPDDDNDVYTDVVEQAAGSDPLNPASTPEVCDGADNDLDGLIDEGVTLNTYYRDADNDTYGNASVTTQACTLPSGYVSNSSDCNDNNASVNPGATEVCNGVDDNCNAQIDEGVQNTYYRDADSDTYGSASVSTQACTQPSGYVSNSSDCNDGNASINPGSTEVCNSVDDNCNTQVDEGCPGVEVCDGIDNDGDGFIDEGFPNTDSDGQADCVDTDDDNDGYTDTVEQAAGSDPLNAASTLEVCDGVDNDLDGQIDEGLTITYYQDSDNDTYGNSSISIEACSLPTGYVLDNTDCNDNNPNIHPSATELCNGIDDNCNGQVDELCGYTSLSLGTNDWMKMECGPWEDTAEGLKVYGTYYRGGNLIKSKSAYNFIGKELFIKWKVNNGGSFSAYGLGLFGVDLETSFSSPNACCQPYTKAITNDTWYYTRIKINPDKTAQHVTSTNDYDINGGTVFASGTKTISDAQWQMVEKTNIVFVEGDTYAGSNAYFVVGEVITDATPVAINFGSTTTYDFEDGTIPSSFYSTGNWTIANDGYNSSRSLYINTSQNSTISLDVTDAVAVSFKIRVNAPTYSGSGFEIIDQRTYWWAGEDFLCWNDIYFNIYGSGTKTLKWSLFNNGSGGGEAWVDDIKIYYSTPPITPIDSDNDGYTSDVDCNDNDPSIHPDATEVCNGVDDNCNGQIDEGVQNTYYRDADNDTYGNASVTTQACTPPSGYVTNSTDCNDGNASINPNATEVCNTIDDNCNGQVDEGCPGVEVCDGIDNDGDSLIDEDFPAGNTTCGSDVQVTPDGVTFTFPAVTLSGDTTVTTSGTGQPPPSGFKLGATPTYYEIVSTAAFSGTVEVCINYDETQFATERSLKLFHWEGSWKDITTSIDTAANIICGDTTSFSPFIVAEELSTAVTLQNISAHLDGNQVILNWSTSFEIDNEGFIIIRGESPGGPFTPITQEIIPAMGGGFKATYTFTDGNVEQGKTYYYRLQDIGSRGRVTAHQVIPVTVDVARKGETPRQTTGQGNNTGGVSQQAGAVMDKDTVGNKIDKPASSPAWLSVVISDNTGKSSVVEIDPAMLPIEGATTAKEVYAGNASRDAKEATGYIETHKQTIMERQSNEVEPRNLSSGTSTFSVSIEDDKGNIIVVNKIEDIAGTSFQSSGFEVSKESGRDRQAGGRSDRPEGLSLQVKEESGRIDLTWEGRWGERGFILHRTEKGKDNYTAITSLIPYFGWGDKDIFLYRFTDKSVKSGVKYDYRLERIASEFKMGRRD